jgi:LPXTG-site transpeptidase (sortase) family protein
VTSFISGNLNNEFIPGDLTARYEYQPGVFLNLSNTSPVLETLNVEFLNDLYVYKSFYPTTVWQGANTRVRVTINNSDVTYPLHQVTLTDTLPDGLVLADPVNIYISSNCGQDAEVNATPGETSFSISNATIPANTSCIFDVYAYGTTNGTFTNTIPLGSVRSYEEVTNPNTATASVTVNGIRISKSISASSILAGEDTTTLTLTIYNPHTEVLTNASLSDDLPGSDLIFVPGTMTTTCETGEDSATLTLSENDTLLTMTGGTIPAGTNNSGTVTPGTCTITADITAPGDAGGGNYTNTIPVGSLRTEQELTNTNAPSDSIIVEPQSITVTKVFSPDRFELGDQTDVVIYLYNPTSFDISGVSLTDEMPSVLTPVQPAVTGSTCGGTVTVDETSITLTGGTIPANSSCNFRATVTTTAGTSTGSYTNSIPAETITTDGGITNETGASDTVSIYPVGLGASLYKSFNDNNQAQATGTVIQLTLGVKAPEDKQLTKVSLTDTLPSGMVIVGSPAAYTSGCGSADLLAETGGSTIQLNNATVNAGTYCYVNVYVTSNEPGVYENVIYPADLTNEQGQTAPSSRSDTIRYSDYTISKSFSHPKITWGGQSVLTITLNNGYNSQMTDVWLQDNLDTMGTGEFVISSSPNASTTCGGLITANPGESTVTLTGGVIPANGSCSISVTIFANSNANISTNTNTISTSDSYGSYAGITGASNPRYSASATLTIEDMSMGLVKNFNPSSVTGGSSSKMTILLINPNDIALEDISFADMMPAGMKVALPMNIDTSTCGGVVEVAADRQSFTYSGGYLAAGRRCTISMDATIRINGNLYNTIPAEAVNTFAGITNEEAASSTLTNLPGVSVQKYFSPDRILADSEGYSILTIHLTNTSNAAVPDMGLRDDFPAGLVVADIADVSPTNNCQGNFTANVGDGYVELDHGYLAGMNDPADDLPSECELTVPVIGTNIQAYRNVIEEGSVTSSAPTVTNPYPAEDTLQVFGTPDLQVVKSVTSTGTFTVGSEISYQIVVTNSGDITLTNVQVTEEDDGAVLGTCSPDLGATLDSGETMTCSATYTVVLEDSVAGEYANTVIADSDQTAPVTDTETVPIEGGSELSIKKSVVSVGPYGVGSTITFNITVKNIGSTDLSHVQVVELTDGVTLGTCAPALDSTLAPGESMVCAATHLVDQSDIDAGVFTNTAQADSTETEPKTDSATVQMASFPSLAVYKFESSTGTYELGDRISFDIVTKNTGNTTLTVVTVMDTGTELPLGVCTINEDPTAVTMPATLQVGDILYCEAYHDVTQADIDAGSYVNTAVVDSAETESESATEEVQMIQIPMIQLEKTGSLNDGVVDPAGQADTGDTVSYTFTVTNIGNVTLFDISIADDLDGLTISGGPITSLAPGASDTATFTGTYSLKQADIDSGSLVNNATVTSYDPNEATITDTDDDTITLTAAPSVSLEKTGELKLDVIAPDDRADVGDQIVYTFTVTNTGNVTLSNLIITDPQVTVAGGPLSSLAPGASNTTTFTGTYTLTLDDLNSGGFTNTASVSGEDPSGTSVSDTDDDSQTLIASPSIELEKSGVVNRAVVAPDDRIDAGDTITYKFSVTNTGNVTLTNIQVADVLSGVTVNGNPIASLDPGVTDSTTVTGTYTLTQADIDLGSRSNTASVTGTDPSETVVTDNDTCITTLEDVPAISLVKEGVIDDTVVAPSGVVNPGDKINYTFTITNIGNVTLDTIKIVENTAGVVVVGDPITALAPNGVDTTTFTASYTLTQEDIDNGIFTNNAEVNANAPDETEVTDEDSATVEISQVSGITIEKIGSVADDIVDPEGVINAGDEIHYQFRIENTGNVTLTDVVVDDDMPDVTLTGCTIAELQVGEVNDTSCSGVYVVTQEDLDLGEYYNSASVTALNQEENEVTDEDDETTELENQPMLGVTKRIIEGPTQVSQGVWQLTYAINITNVGNVTLHDVTAVDDLAVVFPAPNEFTVLEITSAEFDLNWPGYDGIPAPAGDTELLADTGNILAPGESGTVEILVEIIPVNAGPFENSATAYAKTPGDEEVEDKSQDGYDPNPDDDDTPGNNDDPTPIDYGPNLFEPAIGSKRFGNAGLPVLDWSITWINSKNIRPIYARMSDPIPDGSYFVGEGETSGYPLPPGVLPEGTTTRGVACLVGGDLTTTTTSTTYCYYEGPTTDYPRGRIIWEGQLGADYGLTSSDDAVNEINITFTTRVITGKNEVKNVAWLDVDLDGDGQFETREEEVVRVTDTWSVDALPQTGFVPGVVTDLAEQPAGDIYQSTGMWLQIPKLSVNAYITTVPFEDGSWDVTWLNQQVGYLEGSAYPTWEGNTVLTAHNVTSFGLPGPFAEIYSLSYGDQIIIQAYGMTYTYEVREKQLVLDDRVSSAFREEDYDWITLMTCSGYSEARGEYIFRQLVRAVLVSVTY